MPYTNTGRQTDRQEMEATDAKKAERACRGMAVGQARGAGSAGKRDFDAQRRPCAAHVF